MGCRALTGGLQMVMSATPSAPTSMVTRIAPALAMAWGLVWIGVARLTGQPHTVGVAVTAFIVAVLIVAAPLVRLPQRSPVAVR